MESAAWIVAGLSIATLATLVTACSVLLLRRTQLRIEAALRELKARIEPAVREVVREEREAWARDVLRRDDVALALLRKAEEILHHPARATVSEVSRRIALQFERDAAGLRPADAELVEAKRILQKRHQLP
jgi:hypothetical protein